MKKIIALAAAALCAATMAVPATTTPVAAQSFSFGWGIDLGSDWRPRHRHHRWDGHHHWDRWDRWRPRRSGISIDIGPVDIDVRARRGGWRSHVERCEDRYRSYDASTDMYLGYDGDYHRCRL